MFHCGHTYRRTDRQTDGRMYGWTFLPGLLGHLSGDDLKCSVFALYLTIVDSTFALAHIYQISFYNLMTQSDTDQGEI